MQDPSPALLSGLRDQRCCKLWHRLQMQHRSGAAVTVAVAEAGSCSSNVTLSWGNSICHRSSHKKKKQVSGTGSWVVILEASKKASALLEIAKTLNFRLKNIFHWDKHCFFQANFYNYIYFFPLNVEYNSRP